MRAIQTALFVVASVVSLRVPSACAQSSEPLLPGRFELAVGPMWIGSHAFGSSDANETTSSGGHLALFSTSTGLASRAGFEGRVGVKVWRSLEAEASATYATPEIRTEVTKDFETAASATVTERIQQFTIGGSVLWYPTSGGTPSRFAPFVLAGGGYMRQLHEAATLVETGQFYQFGGGVKLLLVTRARWRVKGIGARADVRAFVRSKGVAFDDHRYLSPAIAASLFARF